MRFIDVDSTNHGCRCRFIKSLLLGDYSGSDSIVVGNGTFLPIKVNLISHTPPNFILKINFMCRPHWQQIWFLLNNLLLIITVSLNFIITISWLRIDSQWDTLSRANWWWSSSSIISSIRTIKGQFAFYDIHTSPKVWYKRIGLRPEPENLPWEGHM